MNPKKLILTGAVLGGLLSVAVIAPAAVVVSDLVTDSLVYTAPTPTKVVAPVNVPRRYQTETIRLSLTVDAQGRAHNVELLSARDPSLVQRVLPAVAQWQFKPAMLNGRAVSADIVIPLQFVDAPTS